MANEIQLVAKPRSEFGKGAARRARREGQVPAVLYGHGMDPVHVTLPAHETLLALRLPNVLLELQLESGKQLALPKQVQRDPIKGNLEHVDLVVVSKGEKVIVEVQLHVVGELSSPELILNMDQQTLTLEALATAIPESVEVNIEGLEAGAHITVADLSLPAGSTYHGAEAAADNIIATVVNPKAEESTEDAEASE